MPNTQNQSQDEAQPGRQNPAALLPVEDEDEGGAEEATEIELAGEDLDADADVPAGEEDEDDDEEEDADDVEDNEEDGSGGHV